MRLEPSHNLNPFLGPRRVSVDFQFAPNDKKEAVK
jgi:hypothetical protein